MNTPQFQEITERIISALCIDRASEGWAEGHIEYILEPVETELEILRRNLREYTPVRASEKLPQRYHLVVVPGGVAHWDGTDWISQTGDCAGNVIQWRVPWWMEIPELDAVIDVPQ